MLQQDIFDFRRRDLLSAAIDQILDAPGQGEIAVVIDRANVASAKPTIDEGRGISLRVVAIAAHHVRTAYYDLAGSICRQVPAVPINDRNFSAKPYRSGLVWKRWDWVGCDLMGRFRHAVCFQHGRSKAILQPGQNCWREWSRTRANESCAAVRCAVAVRPFQKHLMNSRHGGIPGRMMLTEQFPELRC